MSGANGGPEISYPPAAGVADRWPMVGRHRELELFKAAVTGGHCDAFLVTGAVGVGKTRLADECLAWAKREGWPAARAMASRAAASVPFGALAQLLALPAAAMVTRGAGGVDVESRPDAVGLYSWTRAALRRRTGGRRLLLFVDDLNLLDPVSLSVLVQLVEAGDAFLLGTVRRDEPVPDAVHRMWSAGRAAWVELRSLSRPDADRLLSGVLGGQVTADTVAAFWASGRGNALFLRELVLGAVEEGDLAISDGLWRLKRGTRSTNRLRALVAARLGMLEPAARTVVEHLAVCGPQGAAALTALAPASVLEHLERIGLVEVQADGRRRRVSVAHPLDAQAIRDGLSRLSTDRILGAQVDRVRRAGARRTDDAVRVAIWQLDGTGRADPELLVRAARLSRGANDFPQVERLARAALTVGPDPELAAESAGLLGDALGHLGRVAEAEQVFASAAAGRAGATRDSAAHAVSLLRALNVSWGWAPPERAMALVELVRTVLDGPRTDQLREVSALILTLCHRPREAYEVLESAPDAPDGPTGAFGGLARVAALAALGRTSEALAASDAAHASPGAAGGGGGVGLHPAFHTGGRALALYSAGRLNEAIAAAQRGLNQAVADEVTTAHVVFTALLGRCHLTAGRPETANRWFRETAAIARGNGLTGQLQLAYAGLALAYAHLADEEASRGAVTGMGPLTAVSDEEGHRPRAYAWSLAAGGDLARATDRLLATATTLEASGQLVLCSALLHDVARLGAPELVAGRLKELELATDSAMVTARAWYANGLAAHDPALLERASTAFESLGAVLHAAEAATQAQRWRGDTRRKAALSARATALLSRCEGARTPPLLGTTAAVPLTPREREVCLLAARNLSSRDIASRLVLSVRTVDNHLQRGYAKLGISRRHQLSAALGPDVGPDGSAAAVGA